MKQTELIQLLSFIAGLDSTMTVDSVRVAAWDQVLPKHITYQQAKTAVETHYQYSRKTIRPADIIEAAPAASQIQQPYQYGMRPLCGNCEQGYVRHPQPPNKHGHVSYHVDLCDCQWIGAPRLGPQHEDNF